MMTINQSLNVICDLSMMSGSVLNIDFSKILNLSEKFNLKSWITLVTEFLDNIKTFSLNEELFYSMFM